MKKSIDEELEELSKEICGEKTYLCSPVFEHKQHFFPTRILIVIFKFLKTLVS
jgi:hypothetical protein